MLLNQYMVAAVGLPHIYLGDVLLEITRGTDVQGTNRERGKRDLQLKQPSAAPISFPLSTTFNRV